MNKCEDCYHCKVTVKLNTENPLDTKITNPANVCAVDCFFGEWEKPITSLALVYLRNNIAATCKRFESMEEGE